MGVEPKIGVFTPPNHPFVHRVFHYFHHPFWGTPIFGNTHPYHQYKLYMHSLSFSELAPELVTKKHPTDAWKRKFRDKSPWTSGASCLDFEAEINQTFQVPKLEGFLHLMFGYFGGWGNFPYISRIHTAYMGEDSSILGT